MAGDEDKKPERGEGDNRPVPRSPLTEAWNKQDRKITYDEKRPARKERSKDSSND